jgi:hypothetical protein
VVPPASRPISRVGRYSGTPLPPARLSATGLSPSLAPRSKGLRLASPVASVGPTTPPPQGGRFGLCPVRSPLLRASRLISLPPGTEMFQFPGFASLRREMTGLAPGRVAPFGHPGISACVPLPLAYRSLPRPSSPPCAQASPTCPRSLDYNLRQAEHAHGVGFRRLSYMSDLCNLAHLLRSPTAGVTRDWLRRSMRTHKSHDLPLSFSFQTASTTENVVEKLRIVTPS